MGFQEKRINMFRHIIWKTLGANFPVCENAIATLSGFSTVKLGKLVSVWNFIIFGGDSLQLCSFPYFHTLVLVSTSDEYMKKHFD